MKQIRSVVVLIGVLASGLCQAQVPGMHIDSTHANESLVQPSADKDKNSKFLSFLKYSTIGIDRYSSVEDFEQFAGDRISEILIYSIDARSTSQTIEDQLMDALVGDLENLPMIRQALTIYPGDRVDPLLIIDQERILQRSMKYAYAKLILVPDSESDEVKVIVLVDESWRLFLNLFVTPDYLETSATVYQLFGIPHELELGLNVNFDFDNPLTLFGKYRIRNVLNSGVDVTGGAFLKPDRHEYGFEFEKEFRDVHSKWAGRIAIHWNRIGMDDNLRYFTVNNQSVLKSSEQDIWLAKAFKLPFLSKLNPYMRLIFSARMKRIHYTSRQIPLGSELNFNQLNNEFYLGSIGIGNHDFILEKDVFYINEPEYLPKGFNLSLIAGWHTNEWLRDRIYSGIQVNYSFMHERIGYWSNQVSYGGFIRDRRYEQITLKYESRYFTQRYDLGKWGFRQFIYGTANIGFNRPSDERFDINGGANGIKGFNSSLLKGERSFSMNLESVIYSPIEFIGFRANLFVFADFAWLGSGSLGAMFNNPTYKGFGFGIRASNNKLGLDYIELSLAFFPNQQLSDLDLFKLWTNGDNEREFSSSNLLKPELTSPDFY